MKPQSLIRAFRLLDRKARAKWVMVMASAACVSVAEAIGALLVFSVIRMTTDRAHAFKLPLVGDLRDRFPGTPEDTLFLSVAIGIAAFFIVRTGLFLGQTYLQHRVAHNTGVSISQRLVQGYMRMPYEWHLQRNSAELIRNSTDSVSQVVQYIYVPAVMLGSESLIVIGMMSVLLITAPAATVGAVAFLAPLIGLLLKFIQPRLVVLGEAHQEMMKRSLQTLQQSLHGIRDISVLGRQRFFEERFVASQRRMARVYYVRSTLVEVPRVVIETAVIVFVLGFLVATRSSLSADRGQVAVLGLFAYAILRVMPAMNRIVSSLNYLRFGTAAVMNVTNDLSELERRARPLTESVEPLRLDDEIAVYNASYAYPGSGREVVVDVSLRIRPGETVGFVGPTGGGKSTLIDLIIGLLEPSSGRITVDGEDIQGVRERWQAAIGLVPQAPFLLDDTVRRNVALGLDDEAIDDALVWDALELAQLAEHIHSVHEGLDARLGERGVRLSGGQRQRVAIARALYRRPSVLVFDEGTSALDNVTEREVVEALTNLGGERTILMVAHRLSTVRSCDQILLIQEGRIEDRGTYDELVERNADFRRMAG